MLEPEPGSRSDAERRADVGLEQRELPRDREIRRLAAEAHTLYVLDEFTYPINWGWIDVEDVVTTLSARPGHQHVIITGRRADPKISRLSSP